MASCGETSRISISDGLLWLHVSLPGLSNFSGPVSCEDSRTEPETEPHLHLGQYTAGVLHHHTACTASYCIFGIN